MSFSPGARVGPYEILGLLGEGGMGEVWKANDTRLDRTVALKVSKESFNERFDREARAVAALNHPNVCQLYDVGPDYLVMEYIDGPTLADRIAMGAVRWTRRSRSHGRLPKRWKPPTTKGSPIGT